MIDASCPKCQARYRLPQTQAGKRVRCKACAEVFPVEEPMEELPVLEEAGADDAPVLEEAEELPVLEEAPRSSLRSFSPRRDEEDERPRPRRRDRDEDEEDDYDRAPQGGGGATVVVLAILGVLLVLGGVGGAIYWMAASPSSGPVAEGNKDSGKPPEEKKPPIDPPFDPFKDLGKTDDKGKPPPPPPPERKPIRTMDDALAALGDPEQSRKLEGLNFLQGKPREEARLDDVAKGVKPLLRDDALRGGAFAVAAKWHPPGLLDDLAALADEKDNSILPALIEALGKYDDEKAAEAVAKHVGNVHVVGKVNAALRGKGKKAERFVLPHLHSKDFSARDHAEKLLADFGTADAPKRAQAVKDLASGESETRGLAVKTLVKTKPDPALKEEMETASKLLEGLLSDDKPFVKEDAWKAMEHWAVPASIPALAAALGEKGFTKKTPLINALARMKDEKAAQALLPLLATDDRTAAGNALIAIGPKAEAAVLPLLGSAVPAIVELAVAILAEVGGKESEKPLADLAKRIRTAAGKKFVTAALAKVKARLK
ncbi:MAG: zinc-ribbon domain-containing protein [Gemmataceae bacterium]|nr:zinc-ribbon domain-containing protein [Gemmataceae bacterium]